MSWQVGLYVAAVFLPLAAFVVEFVGIRLLGRLNAYLATGAIGLSFVLSFIGFCDYFLFEARGVFSSHQVKQEAEPSKAEQDAAHDPARATAGAAGHHHAPVVWKGSVNWVVLGAEPAPP